MTFSTSLSNISNQVGPVRFTAAVSAPVGAMCGHLTKIIDPIGGAILFTCSVLSGALLQRWEGEMDSSLKYITAIVLPIITAIGVAFLAGFKLSLIEGAAFLYISSIASLLFSPVATRVLNYIEGLFTGNK